MVNVKYLYGSHRKEMKTLLRRKNDFGMRMAYYEKKYREFEFMKDMVINKIDWLQEQIRLEQGGKNKRRRKNSKD